MVLDSCSSGMGVILFAILPCGVRTSSSSAVCWFSFLSSASSSSSEDSSISQSVSSASSSVIPGDSFPFSSCAHFLLFFAVSLSIVLSAPYHVSYHACYAPLKPTFLAFHFLHKFLHLLVSYNGPCNTKVRYVIQPLPIDLICAVYRAVTSGWSIRGLLQYGIYVLFTSIWVLGEVPAIPRDLNTRYYDHQEGSTHKWT
jgi:hypothetical protein